MSLSRVTDQIKRAYHRTDARVARLARRIAFVWQWFLYCHARFPQSSKKRFPQKVPAMRFSNLERDVFTVQRVKRTERIRYFGLNIYPTATSFWTGQLSNKKTVLNQTWMSLAANKHVCEYKHLLSTAVYHDLTSFSTNDFNSCMLMLLLLTHRNRDKMDAISQTTYSSEKYLMDMFEIILKCHQSLFLRVQLTIFQHWFRQCLAPTRRQAIIWTNDGYITVAFMRQPASMS